MSEPIDIAVAVPTCGRPLALNRLFRSLADLSPLPARTRLTSLIVVDNAPDASARSVCERAAVCLPFRVIYLREPRIGLSYARNCALNAAIPSHDYLAFVDDDETVTPEWLASLVDVALATGSDAVTGPVIPRYEVLPPRWIVDGHFFERPRHRDRQMLDMAATNNVLVSLERVRLLQLRFDDRFRQGGEDTHFFSVWRRKGCTICWSDNAVVFDFIPAERMTLSWLLRRSFKSGVEHVLLDGALDHAKSRRVLRPLRGLLHIGGAGTVCLLRAAVRQTSLVLALQRAALGAGMIAGSMGIKAPAGQHGGRKDPATEGDEPITGRIGK